jgi:hypothetical protein
MRNLLLTAVIAAILVVVLPRVLNSKYFSFQTKPSPAASTPLPAPGSSAKDGWIKHPSGLGGNGGLGIASLSESEVGRIKVYTPNTLPGARDGQVVRLRFSRPSIAVGEVDAEHYAIKFSDKEHGSTSVLFPKAGAQKMGLPNSKFQPGLSFYVALESGGLRAVGTTWRPDIRAYTW